MADDAPLAQIITESAAGVQLEGGPLTEPSPKALEALDVAEAVWQVVRLEVDEGKTQREIAESLGVSEYRLRRWRNEYREIFMEAYESKAEEMEREREHARRRLATRLARETDRIGDEIESLMFGAEHEGVRLKALELGVRVLGGSGGGNNASGIAPVAAALKAIGGEVQVYVSQKNK